MKILYWSEDDGTLYLPKSVDGALPDGSNVVEGFLRYRVQDTFTLRAEDLDGHNDALGVLLDKGLADLP